MNIFIVQSNLKSQIKKKKSLILDKNTSEQSINTKETLFLYSSCEEAFNIVTTRLKTINNKYYGRLKIIQ